MSPKMFFVLVTGPMGVWLGIVSEEEYNDWRWHQHALELHDARGLSMQPVAGAPNRIAINIGPPYPGDTKQLEIALFPHSVEIIGEILEEKGVKTCSGGPTLYTRYTEALDKWRAALANIHTATPADLANLTKMKNVTKFPGKPK
jgi:hypothetical protein